MNFVSIANIVSVFFLGFFSFFLFFGVKTNRISSLLLGFSILFQAFELLNALFYRFFDYWIDYPFVFYTTEITFFLWGPFIYFYILSITELTFRIDKEKLIHIIPAAIHTVFLLFVFHLKPTDYKVEALQNSSVIQPSIDSTIHILKNISTLCYIILAWRKYVTYKNVIAQKQTKDVNKILWIKHVFVFFTIIEIIQITHYIQIETVIYNTIIYSITIPLWLFLSFALLYYFLKNPHCIYFIPIEQHAQIKSEISEHEIETLSVHIIHLMEHEKIYLQHELKLNDIALKLNVTTKKISRVINLKFEMNFSDFINSYRVNEAKRLLSHPDYDNTTMYGIAYDSGFNSKSTFNRYFQKYTSVTPKEYKKQISCRIS